MYLTVIIAVFMVLMPTPVRGLVDDPSIVFLLSLIVTVLAPVPGVLMSLALRPEMLTDSYSRTRTLKRLRVQLVAYHVYLLVSFAMVYYLIGWPRFVDEGLSLAGWVLVDETLKLVPFVAMLVLAWMPLYRIDRVLRHGTWSLREYVEFHFRQYVLFILAPFALIVTAVDVWPRIPGTERLREMGLEEPVAVLGTVALYVFLPVVLRFVWKTRHMEDGPLRRRLNALCERARMKYSDILVWETMGGAVANACVTGVSSLARYVMVTDGLMDVLSPEEIEAVFAHEIGHVQRHHMIYYVLMAFAFIALLTLVPTSGTSSDGLLGDIVSTEVVVVLGASVLYWGVGFGFVSRRMELEADLYATEMVGSTEAFVSALERISFQSGRPRTASGWRHFSIAKRTQFLSTCEADGARRERFRVGMRILRWSILVVAVAAAASVVALGY